MFKKLIVGVIVASTVSAVADAIASAKKGHETNEHDAEKEIYRAYPSTDSGSDSSGLVKILKCDNCGGELEQNGKVICCPYCGSKKLFLLSSQDEAYRDVEISKHSSYTNLAIEREKTRQQAIEMNREDDKRNSALLYIIVLACIGFLVFGLISESDLFKKKPDHSNDIKVPSSASYYKGENVDTVITALSNLGFDNIETKGLEDLKTGWITKENSVDSVYINGNPSFTEGTWFPADASVIVYYHSFKEK